MNAAANTLGTDAWRRLGANRAARGAAALLAALSLLVVIGPWLSPYDYAQTDFSQILQPPSAAHWFGTDGLGRDLLTRILHGGRVSLAVGLAATLVSLCLGVSWGAMAGYAGGRVDAVLMRTVDILYALPFMFFVILLMVFFGRHILLLFLAIGAINWLDMARIVRGQTLALKEREFVLAARVLGAAPLAILRQHIVPNLLGVVAVYATLTVPQVILVESFLSFLGLGVQAPATSWGALVQDGARQLEAAPWLLLFPGVCLALTLFCLNFLGDGLRDALDPQSREA